LKKFLSVPSPNTLTPPQEKIEELEKKIIFFEEEIKKKDSDLKEQLKVINDLVNMIKNVIFESLSSQYSVIIS